MTTPPKEKINKNDWLITTRRFNKRFKQFCDFVSVIQQGKEPLIVGEGFVVMSSKKFEELSDKKYMRIVDES